MLCSFADIKHAIYINLDSRNDRRELFETHLKELTTLYPNDYNFTPVQRFSAIKNEENGAIGCTKSHIECLRLAKANGWDHILVCEDDALFIHPKILIHQVTSFFSRFRDDWDVVLFAGNNYPPFKVEAPDCFRVSNCITAGCYLVCSRYYDKLIRNFEEGLEAFIANPGNKTAYACDSYWKRLQCQDRWYLITPLCVIQRPGYSDIEKRDVNYESLMLDIVKKKTHPT